MLSRRIATTTTPQQFLINNGIRRFNIINNNNNSSLLLGQFFNSSNSRFSSSFAASPTTTTTLLHSSVQQQRFNNQQHFLTTATATTPTLFVQKASFIIMSSLSEEQRAELEAEVAKQADVIKQLKEKLKGEGKKSDEVNANEDVQREVLKLKELKGKLPPAPPKAAAASSSDAQQQQKQQENAAPKQQNTKADKKAERAAARQAEEEARMKAKAEAAAKFAHLFGPKIVKSETYNSVAYTDIKDLKAPAAANEAGEAVTVNIRARVHKINKKSAKMAFVTLRQTNATVQALVMGGTETQPVEMVAFAAGLTHESIVDVTAKVVGVSSPVTGTTQHNLELHVVTIHCVSESLATLPFVLEDAARNEHNPGKNKEGQDHPVVRIDTRLLTRWLDMRTPASNAIFRIQSRIGQYFRQFLLDNDFIEIHSPKMIGTASEGGASVFKLDYLGGRKGFLAQSPQLYKEMALMGDLERVFEVAPVFRAENANTHRHLTEFVGLDMEMRINEHYFEVLDLGEELFNFMFTRLATHTAELNAINEQHPFSPFVWQMTEEKIRELGIGTIDGHGASTQGAAAASSSTTSGGAAGLGTTDEYGARVKNLNIRMLRFPYDKAVALLNTVITEKLAPTDDIDTTNEKKLGELVKQRYGVDFYIVDRFPLCLRPFYTMPCSDDARFSNSYDIFMRGEEISSGAQRVHIPELMTERAKGLGVDLVQLKDYIDSMRLGAWPHGGFGVGLERVVMLYLGLHNIRYCSLFPRDPQRLTP